MAKPRTTNIAPLEVALSSHQRIRKSKRSSSKRKSRNFVEENYLIECLLKLARRTTNNAVVDTTTPPPVSSTFDFDINTLQQQKTVSVMSDKYQTVGVHKTKPTLELPNQLPSVIKAVGSPQQPRLKDFDLNMLPPRE